jgi:hypothetical protein
MFYVPDRALRNRFTVTSVPAIFHDFPPFPTGYPNVKSKTAPHSGRFGRCLVNRRVTWKTASASARTHPGMNLACAKSKARIGCASGGRCAPTAERARVRYERQRTWACTWRVDERERGEGGGQRRGYAHADTLRTLPASRQNYDPVRFALSAGRDCITMRGIPGIAFTCLELLRGPQ